MPGPGSTWASGRAGASAGTACAAAAPPAPWAQGTGHPPRPLLPSGQGRPRPEGRGNRALASSVLNGEEKPARAALGAAPGWRPSLEPPPALHLQAHLRERRRAAGRRGARRLENLAALPWLRAPAAKPDRTPCKNQEGENVREATHRWAGPYDKGQEGKATGRTARREVCQTSRDCRACKACCQRLLFTLGGIESAGWCWRGNADRYLFETFLPINLLPATESRCR